LFYCSVINVRLSIPAYKPLLICFILLPLWAVFVALARGDLIIISPMGQVVNIIFQVFWFFFESFCFSTKNSSVYAGFRHFIFTIKYHILQNFIVFSAFSLFLSTLFRCVLHLWQHLFYNRTSCKALSITLRYFLFLQKAKNCRSNPGSFFFYSFYLLSIRSL